MKTQSSNKKIYNQKEIKSLSKNMLRKHALKLDQYKAFSGSYKPIITQLWPA